MRKKTWFRGPLLSVLIFCLLIAGAPSMAAADGGGWFKKSDCEKWTDIRDTAYDVAIAGGIVTAIGGAGVGVVVVGGLVGFNERSQHLLQVTSA